MGDCCGISGNNNETVKPGGWFTVDKGEILEKRKKLSRWIIAAFKFSGNVSTSGKSAIVYASRQIVQGTNWCIIVRNNNRLFSIKVFEPLPSEPGNDVIESLVQCT